MTLGRKYVVVGIAAACLLAGGVAFGLANAMASSPSASPAAAKTLVVKLGWQEDPDNLNPFIGYAQSAYEIWSLNYDDLVDIGPDGNPVPELATSVPTVQNGGISKDGKVWTFKIRPGVKWQDGQPLTANDVAFSYNYMIQNNMANYASATAAIERAVVVDPLTVRLICSSPKADMLTSYIPIVPEHIWSKITKHEAENTFTNPPPIIGSGPFETIAFKKGNYVLMKRNPYWWGPKPAIDEIDFEDYTNSDSMYEDLTTGAIDGAVELSPANFQKIAQDKRFDAVAYNFYYWDYVDLNCYAGPSLGNPVLRDVDFRRALATAINQQTIVNIAFHGLAEPGTTIMNPHSWFNPDYHWEPTGADKFTFDLEKAKQMLAAAGYRDVNGDGYVENKAGQAVQPAAVGAQRVRAEPGRGQAAHPMVERDRRAGRVVGGRRSLHRQSVLEHGQGSFHARLRHVPVGLGRLRRPRRRPADVHHRPDRQLERALLVES